MVVVSDRNIGIINVVKNVYPRAEHDFCAYHMKNNINEKFKKNLAKNSNGSCTMQPRCILSLNIKFYVHVGQERPVQPYLVNEVRNEKQAHSFVKTSRYSIVNSNNFQSLNALIVKTRSLSIAKCLYWLRERMQAWFYKRKEKTSSTQSVLYVKYLAKLLKKTLVTRLHNGMCICYV